MFISLQRVQKLTPNIWTFWFMPDGPVRFQAGQYFEVHVPHSPMDERGDKRWLTISSAPHESLLGVTVRFATSRSSTYKSTLKRLPKGARLYASDPIGDFVLPKDRNIPVVFITAGIGSTPVHSMLQDTVHAQEARKIHVIHGVQIPEDLVFDQFFRRINITYSPTVTRPDTAWTGAVGRLSAEKILALVGDPANKLFYFSGPEDFIMQLVYELHENGIQRDQVVLDYFPGYNATD